MAIHLHLNSYGNSESKEVNSWNGTACYLMYKLLITYPWSPGILKLVTSFCPVKENMYIFKDFYIFNKLKVKSVNRTQPNLCNLILIVLLCFAVLL